MKQKQVAVIIGEDASPEVMLPTLQLLETMDCGIDFNVLLVGADAREQYGTSFPDAARDAIDAADAAFFGSTNGASATALFYLRWGKQTYANVRPCRWQPGFNSPLKSPEGIDFVVVRENLEDLYVGIEGNVLELRDLPLMSQTARRPLAELGAGKFALKLITEAGSERVIRFAFELAATRRQKVTVACKYNMLSLSDGLFRQTGNRIAKEYPSIRHETLIIDDFAYQMNANPQQFDVVVMPNLYGDILSDSAAGLIGGLGLMPSGCYGEDYAYFESAHGTAPDIAGNNVINPTATLLSAAMMLDYLGRNTAANTLRNAVTAVYEQGEVLCADQGGQATTTSFIDAVATHLN